MKVTGEQLKLSDTLKEAIFDAVEEIEDYAKSQEEAEKILAVLIEDLIEQFDKPMYKDVLKRIK